MLNQAVLFLLDAIVGFFSGLCMLRFLMQALRVSFSGPLGHAVVTLSNWAVRPLRRVIPPAGSFDSASLAAALGLQALLAGLVIGLSGAFTQMDGPSLALLLLWLTVRGVLRQTVYLMIGALILQAVMSWINPQSPLAAPAWQLTRPILRPIQRVLPVFSGIDLSPLVAILLLQVVLMFI